MTVEQRVDALRIEVKAIENDLRGFSYWSPERKAMQERLRRLARQIAMLTEDQRVRA